MAGRKTSAEVLAYALQYEAARKASRNTVRIREETAAEEICNRDNIAETRGRPSCWTCNQPGHLQMNCRKRRRTEYPTEVCCSSCEKFKGKGKQGQKGSGAVSPNIRRQQEYKDRLKHMQEEMERSQKDLMEEQLRQLQASKDELEQRQNELQGKREHVSLRRTTVAPIAEWSAQELRDAQRDDPYLGVEGKRGNATRMEGYCFGERNIKELLDAMEFLAY